MEEKRTRDGRFSDAFLKDFFELQSEVKRLKEHEANDSKKYERWHQEILDKLIELGKMRLDLSNGRLTALEKLPIVVQLGKEEIKVFFDEWGKTWGEALAGRLSLKLVLWVAGAVSVVITAILVAAFLTYFKLK